MRILTKITAHCPTVNSRSQRRLITLMMCSAAVGLAYAPDHEYRTPSFAACRRSGKRRWIEVWGRVRGAEQATTARLEVRTRGAVHAAATDGWRAVRSGSGARPGGARTAQAPQAVPGAELTRHVRWRHGLQLRLQWGAEGAQRSTSVAVTPTACPLSRAPAPKAADDARRSGARIQRSSF